MSMENTGSVLESLISSISYPSWPRSQGHCSRKKSRRHWTSQYGHPLRGPTFKEKGTARLIVLLLFLYKSASRRMAILESRTGRPLTHLQGKHSFSCRTRQRGNGKPVSFLNAARGNGKPVSFLNAARDNRKPVSFLKAARGNGKPISFLNAAVSGF